MTPETEMLVLDSLRRLVRQPAHPAPKRHKRAGWAGSPCDITCQPCAIAQARAALEAAEAEQA